MTTMYPCRCPECGHKRGEAGEGSTVQLLCRQDKIKFIGKVIKGKFQVSGKIDLRQRRQLRTESPPGFIG